MDTADGFSASGHPSCPGPNPSDRVSTNPGQLHSVARSTPSESGRSGAKPHLLRFGPAASSLTSEDSAEQGIAALLRPAFGRRRSPSSQRPRGRARAPCGRPSACSAHSGWPARSCSSRSGSVDRLLASQHAQGRAPLHFRHRRHRRPAAVEPTATERLRGRARRRARDQVARARTSARRRSAPASWCL